MLILPFLMLNTSPAWGRYVSTNRMMQYGWWSLRHFLLTCEIVIYWIRFYHFVLLCIVFVVLKYNEGETLLLLLLLLYIHRIFFYLFIVILYRKFIENTCDKITVVSLTLYMYIAYCLKSRSISFEVLDIVLNCIFSQHANFIAE